MKLTRATYGEDNTARSFLLLKFDEGPVGMLAGEETPLHLNRGFGVYLGREFESTHSVHVPPDEDQGRSEFFFKGFSQDPEIIEAATRFVNQDWNLGDVVWP